jgi:hypothetical protein
MKKDRRNNRNRFLRKEWRPHMNQDMKKCHSARRPSGCGALPWLHVLRVGLTPRAQVDELRPPPAARRVLTGSYISGTQRQWINNNSPSPNKFLFHLTQSINSAKNAIHPTPAKTHMGCFELTCKLDASMHLNTQVPTSPTSMHTQIPTLATCMHT